MPHVTPLRTDDPRRIGRYRLTARMGDPAAGEEGASPVFVAERADGQTVMVTLLDAGRAADAAARDRFTAEARAARRVPPFCVTRITDSGFQGNLPFLVTDYVPGPSLAEVIKAEGPLSPDTVQALAIGCATGLAAIHQAGLVHGQFGPERVVLSPEGPRVIQFGITPPYGSATPATDMLAWGQTVLFAALEHPPGGVHDLASLPGRVAATVAGCLHPDPAERPTAQDVLAELLSGHDLAAGLLAQGSRLARAAGRLPAGTDRPPEQAVTAARHQRPAWWIAAFAGGLIAVAAGATAYLTHRQHTPAVTITMTPVPDDSSPSHPGGPVGVPAQLAGAWSGTVHQNRPVLTFAVHLSLPAGSRWGTIAYPAMGCSGTLAVLPGATGKLTLRQTISTGRGNCEDGLISLVPQPDGRLAFTFQGRSGVIPTGLLSHEH